ncbi:hypothetical protein [Acinetobacter sp. MB5]|uniref:hypothetical protein n=1 Tax=Acinetobacter sp. MB5 TaxID=2069438 RepID=UPI000DCFE1FD|nr:hypothetical protein [Acinetobacter sp. MB5]
MKFNTSRIGYTLIFLIILLILFQCSQPYLRIKPTITQENGLVFHFSRHNETITNYTIRDLEDKTSPQRIIFASGELSKSPTEIRIEPQIKKQLQKQHAYFLSVSLSGYGDRASVTINSPSFCRTQTSWLKTFPLEDATSFIERCHRSSDL